MTRPTEFNREARPARNTATVGGVIIGPVPGGGIGVIGGETPDPVEIDRANGSEATIPLPPVEDALVVQSASAWASGASCTVVLPATPVVGNTLILWQVCRETREPLGPTGWTAHPDGIAYTSNDPPDKGGSGFFYKVVTAGQSATIVCPIDAGGASVAFIVEVSGLGALDVSSETNYQNGAAIAVSLTPTVPVFMIGGVVIRVDDSDTRFVTPDANSTELFDDEASSAGLWPLSWAAYRIIDTPGGAFTLGGTCSQGGRDWGGQALAFEIGADTTWLPAPNVVDGVDGTYEFVYGDQTVALRLVLDAAYDIARARLRIGIEDAGSVTYEIQAATLADFSDATTVASKTFTATGSFTAQDVEFDWTSTGEFRYWQLVGPAENRNIYAFELYETVVAVITDHGLLDGLTDPDHPASAITAADAAGWFVGTTVEAQLQELAAKAIGYQAHGAMGATETFSALTGWHSGTFDANCSFTLTAAPTGTVSALFLELVAGAGGFALTLPAAVVNRVALEAAQITTAGTTSFLVLLSRDGGTTWVGGWWGGPVVAALDDLTDVVITTPALADRLRFDGSVWRTSALIWTPVTVLDPTTGNYLPAVDGSGNQIMVEA